MRKKEFPCGEQIGHQNWWPACSPWGCLKRQALLWGENSAPSARGMTNKDGTALNGEKESSDERIERSSRASQKRRSPIRRPGECQPVRRRSSLGANGVLGNNPRQHPPISPVLSGERRNRGG